MNGGCRSFLKKCTDLRTRRLVTLDESRHHRFPFILTGSFLLYRVNIFVVGTLINYGETNSILRNVIGNKTSSLNNLIEKFLFVFHPKLNLNTARVHNTLVSLHSFQTYLIR